MKTTDDPPPGVHIHKHITFDSWTWICTKGQGQAYYDSPKKAIAAAWREHQPYAEHPRPDLSKLHALAETLRDIEGVLAPDGRVPCEGTPGDFALRLAREALVEIEGKPAPTVDEATVKRYAEAIRKHVNRSDLALTGDTHRTTNSVAWARAARDPEILAAIQRVAEAAIKKERP
jgi:hypothetical protein